MKLDAIAISDGMYGAGSAAVLAASSEGQRRNTYTQMHRGRGRQAGETAMTKSDEFTPPPPRI